MGIETPADFGGAESSFTAAIIAIEELAKVDPSVSVMCDVHNTLVNTIFRKYGTKEQQEQWLPLLAESKVRLRRLGRALLRPPDVSGRRAWSCGGVLTFTRAARVVLLVGACCRFGCVLAANTREEGGRPLHYQRLKDVDNELV